MSKRLNKRQQREADELAELQRAQASVRPEVQEVDDDEEQEQDSVGEESEVEHDEDSEEEQDAVVQPGAKVLNPFAAVSLG